MVRSVLSAQRSRPSASNPSGRSPSMLSVKLLTGRSGFDGNVFREPATLWSTKPSSRTPTGSGRMTTSPGSRLSELYAKYTGPRTGWGWSGESMIAVPTRELSGHALASA